MSGSPLSEFTTFAQSQGAAWLGSAEEVLIDFTRNTFTWPRLIGAHNMRHMIQGGESISDRIMLNAQDTFQRYDPNASFTYVQGNPGVNINVPWAFAKFDYSWNKHIIGLNKNQFTAAARAQKYKDVWTQLTDEAWANACERMDDELWAQPNFDTMEAATAVGTRVPMSIPAHINEAANGLTIQRVDASNTLWTQKQQVTSIDSTNSNWTPYQQSYVFDDEAITSTTDGDLPVTAAQCAPFLRGMSEAFRKTRFDRLPKHARNTPPASSPNFIACSNTGIQLVEHALIVTQNRWHGLTAGGKSDLGYPYPIFNGVPFDYIAALDDATLYDDGATAADELSLDIGSAGVAAGPRFYGINSLYAKMIIHSENFCAPAEVNPSAQPFSHSMIFDVWNNLFFKSQRRHFIMHPVLRNVPALAAA